MCVCFMDIIQYKVFHVNIRLVSYLSSCQYVLLRNKKSLYIKVCLCY